METSPQLENGYTKIANELLDALAKTRFTELETQALFLIFRNTYGYHRITWEVEKWKVFEEIGIHKVKIKSTLQKLSNRNIIVLDWQAKTISFQKIYSKWAAPIRVKVNELVNQKLMNQCVKVNELVNQKLTNQCVKVNELVQMTSEKVNDDNHPQEAKDNKDINIYIYNEKARELRAVISARYSIPFENKDMPTIQFMIDLLKMYDYEYIERKISELPFPLEHKDISRTLRSWCEHPERSKPEQVTPSYHKVIARKDMKPLTQEQQAFEDAFDAYRKRLRAENRSAEYIRDALEAFINGKSPE